MSQYSVWGEVIPAANLYARDCTVDHIRPHSIRSRDQLTEHEDKVPGIEGDEEVSTLAFR